MTTIDYARVEQAVIQLVNEQAISTRSLKGPRAIGDALQALISHNLQPVLPNGYTAEATIFSKRSMADCAFTNGSGHRYLVDVKSHDVNADFSMPNLTSARRLAELYKNDRVTFSILVIHYEIIMGCIRATDCTLVPIEQIEWSCLTLGALGWGQIQLRKAANLRVKRSQGRRAWMRELCKQMRDFYSKEQVKIQDRIKYFDNLRNRWA
jgi:hypothetical protein